MTRLILAALLAMTVAAPAMAKDYGRFVPDLPGLTPMPVEKPYYYGGMAYSAAELPIPFSALEPDPRGFIPVPEERPKA